MARITFRLSKAEAHALQQLEHDGRKSAARRAAEFKLREAIWAAYPELCEADVRRAERNAHDDNRHWDFRKKVLGR